MKQLIFILFLLLIFIAGNYSFAQQPFTVHIVPSTITAVPAIHSGALATRGGKWIFIGGRRDGLHIMQAGSAFPKNLRNDSIYVVDPLMNNYKAASITSLPKITWEALSSTNMEYYQDGQYLYMIGGYGREDSTLTYITFPSLISINLDCLMDAVDLGNPVNDCIRQVLDTNMAVAGGALDKIDSTYFLIFGHRFDGWYSNMPGMFSQHYTHEIRMFKIHDDGINLSINNYSAQIDTDVFHRRDFNLVPQIYPDHERGFTVFGGVFQKNLNQPFLTPVDIKKSGVQHQASFNQNLNQYTTATLPVYDSLHNVMHSIFFGGLSLYTLDTMTMSLIQDTLVPFVKTISRVMRDSTGNLTESKMQEEMPAFLGANAYMILDTSFTFDKKIVDLNSISGNQRVGFIAGGIHSDAPNVGNLDPTSMSRPNAQLYEVYLDKTVDNIQSKDLKNEVYNLLVYPNPIDDNVNVNFYIKNENSCEITLFDTKGKIVKKLLPPVKLKGNQKYIFSLQDVSNGVYYCHVRVGVSIKMVKVVVGR
jgi:hypothetical protein